MVSTRTTTILGAVAVAACVSRVQGHGYMLVPESQFSGSANSAWIVQIDPQWESSDWNGNTQQSVDTYKSLASEKGVSQIRSLLDDTSIYGADCGFTNPSGTAQPIPTDGKATFSRGIVHVGPCEIWLDDTMVLHDDDCYSTYGGDDQDVKSVFNIDYSSCDSGGCSEMRFYWLAFQGVDGATKWQVYKDCIPLEGGSSGTSTTSETESEADTTTTTDSTSTDSTSTTTTAPSTSDNTASDSTSTTTTSSTDESSTETSTGTVQPSTSSGSNSWGNWGSGTSGGFGGWGNWGGRQLRA